MRVLVTVAIMMHLEKNRMDTSRQTASHYCRMKQKINQIPLSEWRVVRKRMANGSEPAIRYSLLATHYSPPVGIDPVRGKPRRSGRGRIARTPQASFAALSVAFAVARCAGARWKPVRHRRMRRSRTATTERLSSSVSGCRARSLRGRRPGTPLRGFTRLETAALGGYATNR